MISYSDIEEKIENDETLRVMKLERYMFLYKYLKKDLIEKFNNEDNNIIVRSNAYNIYLYFYEKYKFHFKVFCPHQDFPYRKINLDLNKENNTIEKIKELDNVLYSKLKFKIHENSI